MGSRGDLHLENSPYRVYAVYAGMCFPRHVASSYGELLSICEPLSTFRSVSQGLKIAQKPYIVWSLNPKALNYGSFEP